MSSVANPPGCDVACTGPGGDAGSLVSSIECRGRKFTRANRFRCDMVQVRSLKETVCPSTDQP